jgi:hypothetical protein
MQTAAPYSSMMTATGMPHYLDRSKHQRNSGDLSGVGTQPYIAPPHATAQGHAAHPHSAGAVPMQPASVGSKTPYAWWMHQG